MNFQGRLTDSSGNIKPDGSYDMTFRLYTVSSGGSAAWTEVRETTNRVTLTNGLFSVRLGDVTPIPASLFASGSLYLEIELPTPATATCSTSSCASYTEGPMTPRSELATSAYAFNAETLDGIDAASFAQLSTNNTYSGTSLFKPGSDSTTGFQIQNAGGVSLLTADAANSRVLLGNTSADGTGLLLVLDTKNTAGDPTGVDGAMYYNSSVAKFRCYQNSVWTDCIGTGAGGSGTLQDAYNEDVAGAPADIVTTSSTKTLLVKAGASADATSLFNIQDSSGIGLFSVDSVNDRVYVGNQTADSTGTLLVLDTKNTAGEPAGVNGAMYYNSSLAQFRCYRDGEWEPCGTKPIDRGWSFEDDFYGGGTSASTNTTSTPGLGNLSWQSATVGTACQAYTYNNTAAPAPSADRPGILKFLTSATATASAGCRVYLGTTTGGTLGLAAGEVMKAAVAPGSATAGAIIMRVGMDSQTVTSAAQITTGSGVWWEANPTSNANWQYCYGNTSAATCAASTVAITANAMARLEIQITATGAGTSAATFKINGNAYPVSGVTISTANLVRPNILCTTGTTATASVACYADYYQLRGDASAAR